MPKKIEGYKAIGGFSYTAELSNAALIENREQMQNVRNTYPNAIFFDLRGVVSNLDDAYRLIDSGQPVFFSISVLTFIYVPATFVEKIKYCWKILRGKLDVPR